MALSHVCSPVAPVSSARPPWRRPAKRPVALAALLLVLGACTPVLPPIADTGTDAAFKARMALHHGPGTRAQALRGALLAEDFAIADAGHAGGDAPGFRFSATRAEPNLPCHSYVRVDWNEDRRGRISLMQASRLQCR